MIRFIEVNTGNVYNGSKPYVHWFEGKQSVGLNYDKQFIILTDAKCICVKLNSEVFSLVNEDMIGYYTTEDGKLVERTFFDKTYFDLEVLKTKHIAKSCSEAIKFDNYYLYSFNIIAQGKYVGQVTDKLFINDEEFTIGADFYDENEILGINLANFGLDLSNEIQRAIYEKDINEQKPDYVLLNRKMKELLNEYINVLANKGSYKSLINSLKWFEYGDLTKLYEYWKHEEPNRDYLSKRDLTQFINQNTQNIITSQTKTTFIGISCALDKITKKNGKILYENSIDESDVSTGILSLINEPNPKLENVGMMWSKKAMSLKMTLLHNFFATYFLPIHLDLIHTTIENIIYTNTLKITSAPLVERFDRVDDMTVFQCDLNDIYYLGNVETFTNLDTPFGYLNSSNLNEEDAELEIIGVDTEFFDYSNEINEGLISEDDAMKAYMFQHYKGIGTIIPFNCTLDIKDGVIVGGDIIIYKDDEIILSRSTSNLRSIRSHSIDGKTNINFNILIKEIGNYKVQLQFRQAGGVNLIKTFNFSVDEENYPTLKLYKIVPKNNIKNNINISRWIQETDDDKPLDIGNIVDYVLNPVQYKRKYYNGDEVEESPVIYTQFISATKENVNNTVHSNQVFILKLHKKTDISSFVDELNKIYIKDRNGAFKALYNDVLRYVNSINYENPGEGHFISFDGYSTNMAKDIFWMTMDRGGNFINSNEPIEWINYEFDGKDWVDYVYLIGINTSFSIPENTDCSNYFIKDERTEKTPIWIREMFIPYFYELKELGKVSQVGRIIDGYSKDEEFLLRNAPETYIIDQTDVICFLPELKCVRKPRDFMWKFYCSTVNKTIIPLTFRRSDMEIMIQFVPFTDGEGNELYQSTDGTDIIYYKKDNSFYNIETNALYTGTCELAVLGEYIQKKIVPNDNRNFQKTPYPAILQPLFGRYDFSILPTLGYYDLIFNYRLDDAQEKDITKSISSSFIVNKRNAKKSDLPEIPVDQTPDIPVQDELRLYLEEILRRTNNKHGFKEEYLDDYHIFEQDYK